MFAVTVVMANQQRLGLTIGKNQTNKVIEWLGHSLNQGKK